MIVIFFLSSNDNNTIKNYDLVLDEFKKDVIYLIKNKYNIKLNHDQFNDLFNDLFN